MSNELILCEPVEQEQLFKHTYKDVSVRLIQQDGRQVIIADLGKSALRDSIALYSKIRALIAANVEK